MKFASLAALAIAFAASLTACGGGTTGTPATTSPTGGSALNTATLKGTPGFVSPANLTVYTFDADNATPGVSQCSGGCPGVWPPVAPPPGVQIVTPFSVITRSDGTKQLAYSGRPLYTYGGDRNAGDTVGDKLVQFGAEWDIARPGQQMLN